MHRHAGRKAAVTVDDGTTEASCLRNRRLPQVGQRGARGSLDDDLDVGEYWTEAHAQELAFAQDKAEKRRLQAQRERSLLATEAASLPAGAADQQVVRMLHGA